jgi:hypothetical protein
MTKTKELPKNIETWVTALESGEYSQGKGALVSNEGYCCIGVYAKVVLGLYDDRLLDQFESTGPEEVYDKISGELKHGVHTSGITMNDSGESFIDIAKMIREAYT